MKKFGIALVVMMGFIIAACGGGNNSSSNNDEAGKVVEQYLQAKIDSKRDTLQNLLCASQEVNLDREAQSFSGVKAHLDNAVCKKDPNANTVTCTGAIVADYNGENTNFPLTKYNVVQEDGQWKWCGEAG